MHNKLEFRATFSLLALVISQLFIQGVLAEPSQSGREAPSTKPSTVPYAKSSDLKVNILVDRVNFKTAGKPDRVAIVAYLMNIAESPVSVYLPGLAGPIIASNGPVEAIPIVIRLPATGKDTVDLQPGEIIGHTFILDKLAETAVLSARYSLYESGHTGELDHIDQVLYSDGTISLIGKKR